MTNAAYNNGNVPLWDETDRLRKSLRVAKMTAGEMADYLGIARETISTWLNGKHKPSRSNVKLWALRTGVPYAWIVDDGSSHDPDGVHPPGLEPGTHWLRVEGDATTLQLVTAA